MNRTVVRSYIDSWIEKNGPNAQAKLSERSQVGYTTITKARNGTAPKRQYTRDRFCEALGVSEDDLFPILADGEEKAS